MRSLTGNCEFVGNQIWGAPQWDSPFFMRLQHIKQKFDLNIENETKSSDSMKIYIVSTQAYLSRFFKLLEQGFIVKTQAGCSIKDLLCEQLGIDEDYLDNRIQTLFLDGKPVDDVAKAYIQNDATLALSGAMPGLVGATFRKGGTYAALRNTISYNADTASKGRGEARVKLKLFNMVLKELGPIFLENGVWIRKEKLGEFFSLNLEDLKAACSSVDMNGQKIDVSKLAEIDWKDLEVYLKIRAEKPS